MKRICHRCGTPVEVETNEELRKEYPYYCPECDQNMYSFETEEIPETETEYRRKVIHYLTWEDEYLPLNAHMVRSDVNIQKAINSLLDEGIIRMRNCEGAAVELNTAD